MKCLNCQGRVMPVKGFFEQVEKDRYKEMEKFFKEEFGYNLKNSGYQNCIECGQVYDNEGTPLQFKLAWLLE